MTLIVLFLDKDWLPSMMAVQFIIIMYHYKSQTNSAEVQNTLQIWPLTIMLSNDVLSKFLE